MALVEGCKHTLEITVPAEEVEAETGRAVATVQQRAKLPGFRPGKAPPSIIRQHFAGDIRKQVLESLIPKYLNNRFEAEDLKVVGQPDITEVHLEAGEPLLLEGGTRTTMRRSAAAQATRGDQRVNVLTTRPFGAVAAPPLMMVLVPPVSPWAVFPPGISEPRRRPCRSSHA